MLQGSVGGLQESAGDLASAVRNLRVDVKEMHKGAVTADETVHRLAQLLVATQREAFNRFSSLDDRVTRLERKTG